ncbi:hypothetical protein TNCV_1922221 [Trichonephila clavipes]|nr:hypothetical protein TNCV_1922221 [Trichonephila clavipes]
MPRKRKSNFSKSSNKVRAMKVARLNETFSPAELRRPEQAGVRQLTDLLRHQTSPKLDVNRPLNIWHLNGLLRHPNRPKLGVFSRRQW